MYKINYMSLVYNFVRNLIAIQLNGAEFAPRIHFMNIYLN